MSNDKPQMGAVAIFVSLPLSYWLAIKVGQSRDSVWSRLAFMVCAFPILYGLVALLLSLPTGLKGTGALPFIVLGLLAFVSAPVGAVLLLIHRATRPARRDSDPKSAD